MKRDYYEVLGVDRGADDAAIRRAYKKLAGKYHPDRNPGDAAAEKKFKEAQEAHDILSDRGKRQAYDQLGHAAFEHGGGNGAAPDISSIFGSVFKNFFSEDDEPNAGPRQRILRIRVSLEEALAGCTKKVRLNEPAVCDSCRGSGGAPGEKVQECRRCDGQGEIRIDRGFFAMRQTCPDCKGRGKMFRKPCPDCGGDGSRRIARTVSIKIPPGIRDGTNMRLNIQDFVDEFFLNVRVDKHPLFERDGDNLHIVIPVSMTAAALGGHAEAPSPGGGRVKITIPPGTQNGAVLRLRERGAPNMQGGATGDMFCHVEIEVPINLTAEQKKMLRDFDDTLKKKNSRHTPREESWLEKARSFFKDD